MKFFILAVLVAVAAAAPEPPSENDFDPENVMSGKNPDPALLSRVTGIYSRAGPGAAERIIAQSGGGSPQRSEISQALAAAGNADFVIDEVQFAPLLEEFDDNPPAAPAAGGRNGGYNGPPPAARSYGPPAGGGYPSRRY